MKHNLKVGLSGIGLDTYWPQFKGLKARLEGYVRVGQKQLERPDMEVVNLGLIDNPVKALEAGHQFRAADVDLIFLHVTTYALSSTVLPVVQRAKVPVIKIITARRPASGLARGTNADSQGVSAAISRRDVFRLRGRLSDRRFRKTGAGCFPSQCPCSQKIKHETKSN